MNAAGELKLYVNESEDLAVSVLANISDVDFVDKEIDSLLEENLIVGIVSGEFDADFESDLANAKEVDLNIEPNDQITQIKGVFDDLQVQPNAYTVTIYIEYEENEEEELIDKKQ